MNLKIGQQKLFNLKRREKNLGGKKTNEQGPGGQYQGTLQRLVGQYHTCMIRIIRITEGEENENRARKIIFQETTGHCTRSKNPQSP